MCNEGAFNMDLSLEYGEEEFDLGNQLSSASSARSFSTVPSCAPITPQSGRSTPQQHITSLSFNSVIDYESMPPVSFMENHSSADIKTEFATSETSAKQERKPTASPYHIEMDQTTLLNPNLSSYGNVMEFANPYALEHYNFPDPMSSTSFSAPPPPYTLNNSSCDNSSLWSCESTNDALGFLETTESRAVSCSMRSIHLQERYNLSQPYFVNNIRRQLPAENVQQKPSVVHRMQNGGRVARKGRYAQPNVLQSGKHKCQMPECAGKKGYKRSEHLKRHIDSVHNPDRNNARCEFCGHNFNRKDNWKQHLKLHTQPGRSGTARTTYFPEAQAKYDAEMRKTKRRNTAKKSLAMKEA